MIPDLNETERKALDRFMKRSEKAPSGRYFFLLSSLLMLIGAFLFIYTAVITLRGMTDELVYSVFVPGTGGALALILVGVFLMRRFRRVETDKTVSRIIKKHLALPD